MSFCPKCGNNAGDAKFCGKCGTIINPVSQKKSDIKDNKAVNINAAPQTPSDEKKNGNGAKSGKFCPKCGNRIDKGVFCGKCGTKLTFSGEEPEKADKLADKANTVPDKLSPEKKDINSTEDEKICPKCGNRVVNGVFCGKCGTRLTSSDEKSDKSDNQTDNTVVAPKMSIAEKEPGNDTENEKICPKCGSRVKRGFFCGKCGTNLKEYKEQEREIEIPQSSINITLNDDNPSVYDYTDKEKDIIEAVENGDTIRLDDLPKHIRADMNGENIKPESGDLTVCPVCGFENNGPRFCSRCGVDMAGIYDANKEINQKQDLSSLNKVTGDNILKQDYNPAVSIGSEGQNETYGYNSANDNSYYQTPNTNPQYGDEYNTDNVYAQYGPEYQTQNDYSQYAAGYDDFNNEPYDQVYNTQETNEDKSIKRNERIIFILSILIILVIAGGILLFYFSNKYGSSVTDNTETSGVTVQMESNAPASGE